MSDNWVVQNLENALETWNSKLSEIWQLLTTSPQEFKASAHIPEWRKVLPETLEAPPAETAKASPKVPPRRRGRPAKSKAVVATDKESIITKPENEKEIPHGNEQ